jgi:hypothetical protein
MPAEPHGAQTKSDVEHSVPLHAIADETAPGGSTTMPSTRVLQNTRRG